MTQTTTEGGPASRAHWHVRGPVEGVRPPARRRPRGGGTASPVPLGGAEGPAPVAYAPLADLFRSPVAGQRVFVVMGLSGSGKSTWCFALTRSGPNRPPVSAVAPATTSAAGGHGGDAARLTGNCARHRFAMVCQQISGCCPPPPVIDNVGVRARVLGVARERTPHRRGGRGCLSHGWA